MVEPTVGRKIARPPVRNKIFQLILPVHVTANCICCQLIFTNETLRFLLFCLFFIYVHYKLVKLSHSCYDGDISMTHPFKTVLQIRQKPFNAHQICTYGNQLRDRTNLRTRKCKSSHALIILLLVG